MDSIDKYIANQVDPTRFAPAQEPINDGIVATGISADSTTTYMQYAYNVITTASATNYACRLPNPPVKGKGCTIINTSGFPIVVYPSVTGGSINGVVNGSALVPADGKPYVFFCYENPLPGAWTWTSPAINQYDSGEIIVNSPPSNGCITASNPANVSISTVLNGTLDGFNGINKPLFLNYNDSFGGQISTFKPASIWSQITKIKVYTNKIVVGSGITVRIVGTSFFNYYNKSTGVFYDGVQYQSAAFGADLLVSTAVAGTAVPNPAGSVVSLNIGDAGTLYGENTITSFVPIPTNISYGVSYPQISYPTTFGDKYIKDVVIDGVTYEQWYTQYLSVNIIPRCGATSVPFKYRFFIEYN